MLALLRVNAPPQLQCNISRGTIRDRSGESRGRGLIDRQRARARGGVVVRDCAGGAAQTGDGD